MYSERERQIIMALERILLPEQLHVLYDNPETWRTVQLMAETFVAQIDAIFMMADTIVAQREKLLDFSKRAILPMEVRL